MFLVDHLILVCSVLLVIGIVSSKVSARAAVDAVFSDRSRRS